MSNRVVVAIALSVLLVLAGCSGGGTDTPSDEPTDSTVAQPISTTGATPDSTETATPTRTGTSIPLSEVSYPPGTSADGISNTTALITAHNDALTGLDFTGQYNGTTWEGTANRSGRYTENVTVRVDADEQRILTSLVEFSNRQESPQRRESAGYNNGTTTVSRLVQNDETEYRVRDAQPFDQSVQFGSDLREVFRIGSYEPVAAVERDDRTLVRYELTAVNQSQIPENGTVDIAEGTVIVDERGLVHEASVRVRVTATEDGVTGTIERRVTFSLSTGEVTVERPPWVDTAISQQEAS